MYVWIHKKNAGWRKSTRLESTAFAAGGGLIIIRRTGYRTDELFRRCASLGLVNECAKRFALFDRVEVFAHGVQALLGVLQMGLEETTDSISQAFVGKVIHVKDVSLGNGSHTDLVHQRVVEGLLVFGLPLLGAPFVVFTHVLVQEILKLGVFLPKESFSNDSRWRCFWPSGI